MGRKRRGSSTRKHKVPTVSPASTAKATAIPKADRNVATLQKLIAKLTNGVNKKGNPLTDLEISKTKVTISNLEHQMELEANPTTNESGYKSDKDNSR